jgi:hypothetical protein
MISSYQATVTKLRNRVASWDRHKAYGDGPEANSETLLGQEYFGVSDNEVFKIKVTEVNAD